jgi:hypothetical protein
VTIPVAIEADPATKTAVEAILEANPTVVDTDAGTKYTMPIIKPKPGEEYSILRIKPDPDEKYSIIIVDPTTQEPTSRVDPKAARTITEALKKRLEEAESAKAE